MSDPKPLLRTALHKALLLDLEDRLKAEALKAFEMVRDGAGLDKKRARELEGQARFRMMEQGYEEVCAMHGGTPLTGGIVPNTNLKVFQPFMRFEVSGQGVIMAMAAMPERGTIPVKNKSRLAGVSLNHHLDPGFDFDGTGPKVGDVFVLLLVSRDKERAGKIDEVAIGVIDASYSSFLFYESLNQFMSGHGDVTSEPQATPSTSSETVAPSVKLKKVLKPFVPPEAPDSADEADKKRK